MSLKKIGEVKSDKGFKIWDLIIYGAILALVAVLFIVVFTTRDTSPLKGIRVYVSNEVVYEYNFEKGEGLKKSDCIETIEDGEEKLIIKVNVKDGGYNVLEITKSGGVKVTQANCGPTPDCVYTPEIKNSGGSIYCSPHMIKIVPYGFDVDGGTVIM